MKKHIYIILIAISLVFIGCQESEFADNYTHPNKIGETTVPKQFTGVLRANLDYVLPNYRNYFVVLRTTLLRWTQAAGWINSLSQYQVGAASVDDQWNNYYTMFTQYRELEKVYSTLTVEEQQKLRIYWLAASIYVYDHTQDMVDLFGYIPFSEAGKLSQNGGDYLASLPAYDSSQTIYTKMLDDLKAIADELNSISIDSATKAVFDTQDYINHGDILLWKKYCNSLRLRILNRVSGASEFSSRSETEMASILGNSSSYPVIESNDENIQIEVVNLDTPINSKGFEQGFGSQGWYTNYAGKRMVDHMNDNTDPRIRAIYELGSNGYQGIDPLGDPSAQTDLADNGDISLFNRSTFNQNEYFPGMLMNAAEVNFLKAEYYLREGNDGAAKTAYDIGIQQSIEWYYWVRSVSNDDISGPLAPLGATEVDDYIAEIDIAWGGTDNEKLELIATQKWLHYSVVQLRESWAEQRRLDLPSLQFSPDDSNTQSLPPVRWLYPDNERSRNSENFQEVISMDNMTTKIFWDAN
ncbi:SusD/RagB family nutrient-binding outer membrane lipoprotein [Sabulilitoribacter arenilitoris]|uniref:SusD/RagB family nutrient-binding outer membrane lipoprotein n=1 Tax=Wocania arenilitoris TaxID=2044858 RepID=A0AAE3JME6_9FLAO|nr:SusD/RagB family nutrient-binding outer membrane lipoprotein [Wocania arenilitoris]MCF7569259.1 SusD/RagB family nutrient-binding outer membrane lipoprotein [Wocania arenilitoris]